MKKRNRNNNTEASAFKTPVKNRKVFKRRDHDEEIDSEEEEAAYQLKRQLKPTHSEQKTDKISTSLSNEDTDDENFNAKRVGLAKKFLENIGLGVKTDDEVAARLHQEAEIASKRVHYDLADKIHPTNTKFYRGHKDAVTCVTIGSKENTKAYTGSKDCSIILWDLNTGSNTVFKGRRKEVDSGGHFGQCLDICASDDGRLVFSVGQDRYVRLWDTRASTQRCTAELVGHTKTVTGVCLAPDSNAQHIYTVSEDLSLRVWNISSHVCEDIFYGHTSSPNCIDNLVPDRPVTGGCDSTTRLWKVSGGTHFLYEGHSGPVDAVVQLNGHRVLSGSQDGSIALWSVGSRHSAATLLKPHGGNWITALGCIRYSDVVFSGSDDGWIRCWKISQDKKCGNKTTKASILPLDHCNVPIAGVINQLVTSGDGQFLLGAVSKEHRRGRWKCEKRAENGLLIVPLNTATSATDLD